MRFFGVLLACALGVTATQAWAAGPQTRVAQGALLGIREHGVNAFRGIPFAAPPIGKLRWQPPAPVQPWSGLRRATHFGPICPQNVRGPFAPALPQSESCLTLNVWTTHLHPAKLQPVMVWIYGGGFVEGGSALPYYDGSELARRGVVVVSFNYRLGWLGFFDDPDLAKKGEATGNYGLMDQIAALTWVRQNIAAFGGDPNKVTIFGESAGGMSVNDLMTSPLARGLFIRAISESGLGLVPLQTAQAAEHAAKAFLAREHITGDGPEALTEMRRLPVRAIVADLKGKPFDETPAPMIDGTVLREQPVVAFAEGAIAHAAYLAGSNSNEASLITATGLTTTTVLSRTGSQLPQLRALYAKHGIKGNAALAGALFDDRVFAAGAQGLALYAAHRGEPAFVYYFAYVPQKLRNKVHGVGHGYEVPFVFGNRGYLGPYPKFAAKLKRETTAEDRVVRRMVQTYWTNFAKTGNPNGVSLPRWPATRPGHEVTLVIRSHSHAVHNFHGTRLASAFAAFTAQSHLRIPH